MLEEVSKDSDGYMPGDCPRDVQQLYDLKAQMKQRTQPIDPYENISVLMAAEGNDKYIRRVTNTPESHNICLYTDDMVDFMQRHCGFGNSKSPIHVDTTYDLTNGYVVLCTLRAVRCQGSPLIVGPALITKRQRASDFAVLWQSLPDKVRALPAVFVTDGEEALIKSILESFPNARMFRCRLHLMGNVKAKMRDLSLENVTNTVVKGMKLQMSFTLADFIPSSTKLYHCWRADFIKLQHDQSKFKEFLNYYTRQVEPVLRNNLIEMSVAAGVGYQLFDNNPSESANAIVKGWCDYKKLPVDELCRRMKIGCCGQLYDYQRGMYGLSKKFIQRESNMSGIEVKKKRARPLHHRVDTLCDLRFVI